MKLKPLFIIMAIPQPTAFFHHICTLDPRHQHPKTEAIRWLKFRFKGYLRSRATHPNSHSYSDDPQPLTTITLLPLTQLPQYIGLKRFYREGPYFLRTNLSNPYLSRGDLDQIVEGAIYDIQQILDALTYSSHQYGSGISNVIDLGLVIFIDTLPLEEEEEDIEEVVEEEFMMIPASHEAIHLLKKIDPKKECGLCSICMEDFGLDDSVEVLAMPCDHVFHQQCIGSWLEISHTCPMCRHPMPIANTISANGASTTF